MTQLTSIQNLRASTAMQSRVTTVENFLKRLNRNWNAAWFFPIAFINVSNGDDDMHWVRSHTSTHHKGDGNLQLGGLAAPAASVIEALKGLHLDNENDLQKIDAALQQVFGQAVSWTVGLVTPEVAAAQVPFVAPQTAAAAPAAAKKVARKSSTVKPIATKPSAKTTKLDEAKALFANLTPKQKVELVAWAEQKVLASKPCLVEREKLNTASA